MGKKRISNIPSRKTGSREAGNIQLMKEKQNTNERIALLFKSIDTGAGEKKQKR